MPRVEIRQFPATARAFNLPHLHLAHGITPFEFCRDLRHQKTRFPGLSCGVVCVILRLAISVEDRLVTDGPRHNLATPLGVTPFEFLRDFRQ